MAGGVLVTGSSGFVGEHVARRLAAAGESVVGTYLTRQVAVDGAEMRRVELSDAEAVARLIEEVRPRAVIHTAAMTSVDACRKEPEAARRAIVEATKNIVRAMEASGGEAVFVHVSTDLVFDGERAPYAVGDAVEPVSVYGRLKLEAEGAVAGYARGVVVRPALVYGSPTTHKGSFLGWMTAALKEGRELTLYEDEVRTPVWVADLAAGLVAMTDGRALETFHAGGPERLNRYAMGEIVADALGAARGLLVATKVADAPFEEPRARDVSLESGTFWELVERRPATMRAAMARIVADS